MSFRPAQILECQKVFKRRQGPDAARLYAVYFEIREFDIAATDASQGIRRVVHQSLLLAGI